MNGSTLERMLEYRHSPRLNYSYLKQFLHPDFYLPFIPKESKRFEDPEHFSKGNLVDCLFLFKEDYPKIYYTSELMEKPSDVIISIIHTVAAYCNESFDKCEGEFLKVAKERNYGNGKFQDSVILDRIRAKGKGEKYYNSLIASKGKTVVSQEEKRLAVETVESLLDYPEIKALKDRSYSQVVLYFTYKGYECKALLDMLEFVDKKTIRVVDLKTTSKSLSDFESNIRIYRYDVQLAFYTLGLKALYPDYTILPPQILAVSFANPGVYRMYTLSQEDHHTAIYGSSTKKFQFSNNKDLHLVRKDKIYGIEDALRRASNPTTFVKEKVTNLW